MSPSMGAMTGMSTNHVAEAMALGGWRMAAERERKHRSGGTGLPGTPTSSGFTNGGLQDPHVVQP
jgi:hypothetical protein